MKRNIGRRKLFAEEIALAMELNSSGTAPVKVIASHFGVAVGTLEDALINARRYGFAAYPPRREFNRPPEFERAHNILRRLKVGLI